MTIFKDIHNRHNSKNNSSSYRNSSNNSDNNDDNIRANSDINQTMYCVVEIFEIISFDHDVFIASVGLNIFIIVFEGWCWIRVDGTYDTTSALISTMHLIPHMVVQEFSAWLNR